MEPTPVETPLITDWLTFWIACAAFAATVIAICVSARANRLSREANDTAEAALKHQKDSKAEASVNFDCFPSGRDLTLEIRNTGTWHIAVKELSYWRDRQKYTRRMTAPINVQQLMGIHLLNDRQPQVGDAIEIIWTPLEQEALSTCELHSWQGTVQERPTEAL